VHWTVFLVLRLKSAFARVQEPDDHPEPVTAGMATGWPGRGGGADGGCPAGHPALAGV